ncbi:MAG: S-layer homology domain-containing protein [Clostridia bacterium]|nr:S-layer homology domain-containing protein [Clostridia bacterium]
MKKIGVLICLISVFGTAAAAAEITTDVSIRKVTVTVTDTLNAEKPTLQVLDKEKTRVLYTAEGILSEGKYIFDVFSMGADEASGDYIVRIGENGKITETTMYYASYTELVKMIDAAKSETVTSQEIAESYGGILNVNTDNFSSLPAKWKNRITKEIKSLSIDNDTDENIKSGVRDLKNVFEKWMNYGNLASSSDVKLISKAVGYFTDLDTKYYEKLSDISCIKTGFEAVDFDEEAIGEAELSRLFDGAVLTGVIIQNDWATGREAVKYYTEKGLIALESKYLSAGSDTYKSLKQKNITNYNDIPPAIKSCYDSAAPAGSSGGSGGSGSSGGSGGKTLNNAGSVGSIPVSTDSQPQSTVPVFSDIDGVPWAKAAIEAFAEKGILSGKSKGIFAPDDTMTRAEFVKVIVSALGLVDENAAADFDDVSEDAWYYKYVASGKKAGLVSGVSDTHFGAQDNITRQDMAVIVSRIAEIFEIKTENGGAEFSDGGEISDYAKEAVSRLSGAGIINGMGDGTFSPKSYVTRAQGAKVIYDIISRKGRTE